MEYKDEKYHQIIVNKLYKYWDGAVVWGNYAFCWSKLSFKVEAEIYKKWKTFGKEANKYRTMKKFIFAFMWESGIPRIIF